MKHLILYISLFYLIGCNLFQGQQPAGESVTVEEKQEGALQIQQKGETFVPIKEEGYVINYKAPLYRIPDINSPTEDAEGYFGNWQRITGESEHFYRIEDEGQTFFFLKKDIGKCEQIEFTKESLERCYNIFINGEGEKDHTDFSQFLSVTPIGKEEYLKEQENGIDLLKKDTLLHSKINQTLVFNCKNKIVKFKDELEEEQDDSKIYEYEGYIESLGQYVVSLSTLGWIRYILIDKITGKQIEIDGFPYASPDKKHIICLIEGMDMSGFIILYEIKSLSPFKVEKKLDIVLSYWTPYDDKGKDIFWDKEGNLYVSINKETCFYINNTKYNPLRKYAKIRIK